MCSLDVCLCFCLSVCVQRNGQSDLKWALNANSSKTVKATDFKFDVRVYRDSQTHTDGVKHVAGGL